MRQIPTSGEYCGDCPCAATNADFCFLYHVQTEPARGARDEKRCTQCLQEQPQVLTLQDRQKLIVEGANKMSEAMLRP